jgi:dihydropteroate synthase
VDTRKAAVARRALAAGARIVNDVSALTADPDMPAVAAASDAGLVLMHMLGTPETMQRDPRYADVVEEVALHLEARLDALLALGVAPERVALDPGIGFGKTVAHNLALLRGLPRLARRGRPVVVGVSRKSFLGRITGREVGGRLAGSLAAAAFAAARGAGILRVHDVRETVDALRVWQALAREGEPAWTG